MQFRSAAESDPNSAKAHWGLARSYENLGQFNEALEELRETVEIDGTNLDAKAKLGNYFLLITPPMIGETETIRDEILERDPKFVEGHMLTASIMAAQGLPDSDVINAVNRAIQLDPKRIESYISLQRFYMTREKTVEAEKAIKTGIDAAADPVLGHIEYGRFLMYSNRDREAETEFEKAILLDGTSIEAREAAADFFLISQQVDKAEGAYLELVDIQGNSPESRLDLADFYAKAGRGVDSLAVLEGILADTPEYARARYKLGQAYLDRKNVEKVNEQLNALLAVDDQDAEALMLRARLYLQQNAPDKAIADLESVLKKQPSGRDPLFLMAQARLSTGETDLANAFIADLERYHPNDLKSGLLKIQAAFSAGDPENALKLSNTLLEKVNQTYPDPVNSYQTVKDLRLRAISSRGLANLDLGKLKEAHIDLETVVKASPKSATAVANFAKLLIAERNFEKAGQEFERASVLDPSSFDAISGFVDTSIKLGRVSHARAKTDELLNLSNADPGFTAGLHYLRSIISQAERDPAAAEKELLAAMETDPNYLPAYTGYAALLVGQNRIEDAVGQYQAAIRVRPTAQVYTLLGMLEDSRGRFNEAETAYRKALEISPDLSIAANNLSWLIAQRQGNLDEALQLATVAVYKNPTVPGFHDTLGWVYLKKGLTSPAIERFKKAVALDEAASQRNGAPPNAGYRVRLGMALAQAGDSPRAKREAQLSLRSSEDLNAKELADSRGLLGNAN